MANYLTTSVFINDTITGKKYPLNKWLTSFQPILEAQNDGIITYVIPTLPGANPADIAGGKEITIARALRDKFAYKTDLPTTNDSSRTFQPAADEIKTTLLGSAKPELSLNTKIIDMMDETLLKPFLAQTLVGYFGALNKLHREKAINLVLTKASSYKRWNNVDEKTRTAQPAASSTRTIAEVQSDIDKGIRIPVALASATWNAGENRVIALRKAIDYFKNLGTSNSVENGYPFALTGYDSSNLVIFCKAGGKYSLKANGITQITNAASGINQNWASLDGVEIIEEKLLPADVEYVVMTKDHLFKVETPLPQLTQLGQIERGISAVVNGVNADGSANAVNLTPTQAVLKFNFNIYMDVFTPGGAIIFKTT